MNHATWLTICCCRLFAGHLPCRHDASRSALRHRHVFGKPG